MFKNKTEQNRNDEKYGQMGTTLKIYTSHDGFRATTIMLSPSRLARSSWRSPVIAVKKASEIKSAALRMNNKELALMSFWMPWVEGHISHCSRVLQCCHPEQSSCSGKFRLLFIHKTLALNNLFSNCYVKKTREAQFERISLNISLSDSVLETKRNSGKAVCCDTA